VKKEILKFLVMQLASFSTYFVPLFNPGIYRSSLFPDSWLRFYQNKSSRVTTSYLVQILAGLLNILSKASSVFQAFLLISFIVRHSGSSFCLSHRCITYAVETTSSA